MPPFRPQSRSIRGRRVHVVVCDGQEYGRVGVPRPAPYYRKSYQVEVVEERSSASSSPDKDENQKEKKKKKKEKRDYWTCGVVHAVLASSAAPVCIGQKTVIDNDENGTVLGLDQELQAHHRWLAPGNVVKLADAKHGTTKFFEQQGGEGKLSPTHPTGGLHSGLGSQIAAKPRVHAEHRSRLQWSGT